MTHQIESLKKLSKIELGTGDRLCRIIAKGGKIGAKTMESQAAIVPVVAVSILNSLVNDPVGREYLCNAVADVQDSIIRSLVEKGKLAIFEEQIGLSAIIDAMKATNESQRFSKESIKAWFDAHMVIPLTDAIVAKYAGIDNAKVNKMLAQYLDSFQVLAGRNPSMPAAIKNGLIRALEFLPDDHDTATATEIVTRLQNVQEPTAMLGML